MSTDITPTEATSRLHAKVVNIEITQDFNDKDRTIEQFIADIKEALVAVRVKRTTVMSSHYILDGRVCRPEDYDPQTQYRKPGTYPPPWAGGPSVAEAKALNERATFTKRDWTSAELSDELDKDKAAVAATLAAKPKRKPRARSKAAALEAAGDLADAMKGKSGA